MPKTKHKKENFLKKREEGREKIKIKKRGKGKENK